VRNAPEEEPVLVHIERNPLILLFLIALATIILWLAWQFLKVVDPWGFFIMLPGVFLAFQALWLMLNPFAMFYKDKVQILQSFIHRKERYFVDIKKLTSTKKGKFYITYNDDEVEKLNLFGIRHSQLSVFKDELQKYVSQSITSRN